MILNEIAAHARERVEAAKQKTSLEAVREAARSLPKGSGRFEAALKLPGLSFICEVKKASPSKGVISPDFPYLRIAREYEEAGADCVSCLTEPKWFLGSDGVFRNIRAEIGLPMLRKDFTVDEYQLYEAKLMGADAVLLICALLDAGTVARFLGICGELGMAALVEAYDEGEIESALIAGARIIGVNNRNLKNFSVDFSNSARLRDKIPPGKVFVAESGVHSPKDVAALKAIGADAVLIGEALMRSEDKRQTLAAFRKAAT